MPRYPRLPDVTYACQDCGQHFTPAPDRTFPALPPYRSGMRWSRLVIRCLACQDAADDFGRSAEVEQAS